MTGYLKEISKPWMKAVKVEEMIKIINESMKRVKFKIICVE